MTNNYGYHLEHGGKWGYTNGVKNGNRTAGSKTQVQKVHDAAKELRSHPGSAPKEYQPQMKPNINGDGFVDENGYSFKGTAEEARQKKYQWDLQQAKLKQKAAQEKAQYDGSLKKKVDDTGKDIEKAAKYVSKVSKETVDKGKKFLASLFD